MIILINISIYLIFFYLLFFGFLLLTINFVINFILLEWNFLLFKYNFYLNSLLFSFILLIVSLRVFLFRSYYLNGELNFLYYLFVLIIFIFRIFSLNFSFNSFSILLRWDLLGISRFFLVLFYNNWDRCRGSINTVLTNRVGDFFIFLFFIFSYFLNYSFLSYSMLLWSSILFLILTAFTKSAQFPFSGWLPKAMSAPTPVSSLVHRSTLVTAGLLLLFNFSFFLFNYKIILLIFIFGLLTTFFASFTALLEEDIKKVVALRTLSQIGFAITTLGLGSPFLAFVHLLSHALFKSCLFLQVGYFIHCSFGQQDGRYYGGLNFIPDFIQIQLLVTLFCLCGLFFTRGLISKDLILEFYFSRSWLFILIFFFFVSVYLTFFYRYRLFKAIFIKYSQIFIYYRRSRLINFLSLIVCTGSIFFIWWLNLNLLVIPSFFLGLDFFVPIFYLFLFFLILYFSLKLNYLTFNFKFLADYFPKWLLYLFLDLKYMEFFLYNLRGIFISFFSFLRITFNMLFFRNIINSLTILFFLVLIMLWGLILL